MRMDHLVIFVINSEIGSFQLLTFGKTDLNNRSELRVCPTFSCFLAAAKFRFRYNEINLDYNLRFRIRKSRQ